MTSSQCNQPKKTFIKLNVSVPMFILFHWYRYYMMNGIEILRLLVAGPTTKITTAMQNLGYQI